MGGYVDLRWGFFADDRSEKHPVDCECHCGIEYDGKVHKVVHMGGVCFVANVGTWADLKRFGEMDWDHQAKLAGLWSKERLDEERLSILRARIKALEEMGVKE